MGFRRPDRRFVLRWAWASLVANTLLVLTGALVRLTGSGLGCPTWPKCTDSSFVPHRALGVHGVIEFGNRMLTYVLTVVAIATFVAVWRWTSDRLLRNLVLWMGLGIPLQAVIGGITVLTDLNPWVVALHLILSLALIAAAVFLLTRLYAPAEPGTHPSSVTWLVRLSYLVLWAVVYVGTVVTGSGPHAGDAEAPRNGLDPAQLSQFHADMVFLLIGLTIGCWLALRAAAPRAARIALALLVAELAQGLIGFVQYLSDLPIVLVAAHLVGAAVLIAVATWLLLETERVPARVPALKVSR